MTLQPGIHDIPAAAYHADPAPAPSLSASIAKVLLNQTPRHAWLQHPRLNPHYQAEVSMNFDLGSAAHALILGDVQRFVHIDAENFRTKAAQNQRDEAYAAGLIPLLPDQWETVQAMAGAARAQLSRHEDASGAFTHGKPEQTLIWEDDGIYCRLRLDWLPDGGNVFYDYKTTSADAGPNGWGRRQLFDLGNDIQAGIYRRGIQRLLGIKDPVFRFVVQETKPPYALCVHGLSPATKMLADAKAYEAVRIWRWCTSGNRWPGYPRQVVYPDTPPWQALSWESRIAMAEGLKESENKDMLEVMLEWQAPQPTTTTEQ
jgi:hypothetical protein